MPSTTPRVWPPHGDAYLREHHKTSTLRQMGDALGVSYLTAGRHMDALGLPKQGLLALNWPQRRRDLLLKLAEKHPQRVLAELFGVNETTIWKRLKEFGAPPRVRAKRPQAIRHVPAVPVPARPAVEAKPRATPSHPPYVPPVRWGSYNPERICTGNMRGTYSGAELRAVPARPARFQGASA